MRRSPARISKSLRDEVGETAYLVIFSQGEIVQLCKADGKQAVSASVRSMVREPAYCTATGKVLLSGLAPEAFDKYVADVKLQTFTPQTIASKAQLRREIAKVRQSGFALDAEEYVPNLCCVSVPCTTATPSEPSPRSASPCPRCASSGRSLAGWCERMRAKSALISQQLGLIET